MKLYQEASVFDNDQMADDITDASTKAKSYMSFKSGYGLMIADLTGEEVAPDEVETGTRNLLISPTEVMIRNGQINIARFGSSIYLDEEGGGVYIGKRAEGFYNTRVLDGGMQVYNYDTQIANFGESIWLGNVSNFSVDLNGKLTSNSFAFKNGTIGNWSVDGYKFYSGDGSENTAVAIQSIHGNMSWVIAAGGSSHSDYSDAPFRVKKDGTIYAKRIYIGDTSRKYMMSNSDGTIAMKAVYGSDEYNGITLYADRRNVNNVYYPVGFLFLGGTYLEGYNNGLHLNATTVYTNNDLTIGRHINLQNGQLRINSDNNRPILSHLLSTTNNYIAANSGATFTFYPTVPDGFTILGTVLVTTNHGYACTIGSFATNQADKKVTVTIRNNASSDITDLTVRVRVLMVHTSLHDAIA